MSHSLTSRTDHQREILTFHRNLDVYNVIATRVADDGWCHQPIAAIAEAVGLDEPHARMALIELIGAGLVEAGMCPSGVVARRAADLVGVM